MNIKISNSQYQNNEGQKNFSKDSKIIFANINKVLNE